ncbi:MAG TPA: AraC family transcriptional regulator [Verrucomicrobiales bacterium]|nr:AraC family transcriptional regulator [Verrucomicrobiales bacterium]HRJ08700.1 AraC family transcriptional regulator [Prosthecobacter sp.]HRK14027.1 AraC family transcriptional regulator [Prosthecobacter sp.]
MRNATPLQPRSRQSRRSLAEIQRWRARRAAWFSQLDAACGFQALFDHIPAVFFFAKDREGHLMFASKGLLGRYQMRDDSEFIGRTDFDLNPGSMAQAYVEDDAKLLRGRAPAIERMELWWDRQGMPDWYLVTKLPLRDRRGRVQGIMGILRRADEHDRRLPVFQTVSRAVEIIRRDFARPITIGEVAGICGESLRQLQRRFLIAFGIGPQEFLIKTRVLAAARLLDESDLTAAEVATRCGFVDASSFTQQFKQRTGTTPARYGKRRTPTGPGPSAGREPRG